MKTFLTLASALVFAVSAIGAEKEESPLHKEMKVINKSLRTLKRQVADPAKKDDNLQLLATIRKSTKAAHDMEPAKTKDQSDKAAYITKYKEQMTQLDKTFEEVETAIKADKPDDAKKSLEKLSDIKEKGHKDFGVDED